MKKALLLKTTLALVFASPLLASAESSLVGGTGTANARLNLQVVIPGFIALKVGTGAILSNTNTVDLVNFTLTDAQAAADGTVGATSGGVVPVQLISNIGSVNFSSAGAALTDGTDSIPLSRITVASAGTLAHPAFGAAACLLSVAHTSVTVARTEPRATRAAICAPGASVDASVTTCVPVSVTIA